MSDKQKPLTDQELQAIEATADEIAERAGGAGTQDALSGEIGAAERAAGRTVVGLPVAVAIRLVDELRRLRVEAAALAPLFASERADLADEIKRLRFAAKEAEDVLAHLLAITSPDDASGKAMYQRVQDARELLRKQRDGKA